MYLIKYFSFLICFAMLVLSTGCAHDNYEKPMDALVAHFVKSGLKVSYVAPLNYYVVQAEAAYRMKIGSREVGIYKYNPGKEKQAERLRKIESSGVLYVVGKKFTAVRNGSYVLIDHDSHPDSKKIVDAFEKF